MINQYLRDNFLNEYGWITEYKTTKAAIIGSLNGHKMTMHDDQIYKSGMKLFSFFKT